MKNHINNDKIAQIAEMKMQADGMDEVEQEMIQELLQSIDFNSEEVSGMFAQQLSKTGEISEAELYLFVEVLIEELKEVMKITMENI